MDSRVLGAILLVALIILSPLLCVAFTAFCCIAYSHTKSWDKRRKQRAVALESESHCLVESSGESYFYDTDEEEEHIKHKVEDEDDQFLTFNQKFWKEFKKVCMCKGKTDVLIQRERKERKERRVRKLAKAVALEMSRIERKATAAQAQAPAESEGPPAYTKA